MSPPGPPIERLAMKLDAHVHTRHSCMTTIWPWSLIVRESASADLPEAA
jgi:hypothetical protein